MKIKDIKTAFMILAISALFADGCSKETPVNHSSGVEVVLNGAVNATPTNTKAAIHPIAGNLPPFQLSIGIGMLTYATNDTINDQPSREELNDLVAWRRAYFGGPGLPASTITNGEIKFTSWDGTTVQRVVYEETGLYYFLKAYYPYAAVPVASTIIGGSVPFFTDGSQDIMCTNLAWGNMDNPHIPTLNFKHLLTKLNVRIYAQNDTASADYGKITSVELAYQPNSILVDMFDDSLEAGSALTFRYPFVGAPSPAIELPYPPPPYSSTPDPNASSYAADFGYVMAMPSQQFTLRIGTEKRLNFYIDLDFPGGSAKGTAYNITLQFMQTDEIRIYAEEAKEWWMDSTFN